MPVQVVDLNLVAETGAPPKPTYTAVGIIGTSDTQPTSANFGEVNRYTGATAIEDDYGSGEDVVTTAEAVFSKGAEFVYVLQLEETETTETLNDGDTLTNTPALGQPVPTAASGTIEFVAGTPSSSGLSSSEHQLNTDTGEFATGGTDIDVTYSHADFSSLDLLNPNADRLVMADRQMGREHIGVLDELVGHAGSNRMGVVAAGINGANQDEDTVREEYHDTFGYVASGDLLPIAHKSGQDPAGEVAGQLAINDPWFDPFYDGDGYSFNTGYYQDAQVGDPSAAGTFEGGDQADQVGPVNVVINKGVQVLSNSLSTAGASSNYQFFDISMTQNYIATEIERNLEGLRLQVDQIPFSKAGRQQIRSTIVETLNANTGGTGQPLSDFSVTVPKKSQLTESQVANRVWGDIKIDAVLAGNVHEFGLTLTVGV